MPRVVLPLLVASLWTQPLAAREELVAFESDWRYFRGRMEPSSPLEAWRESAFDDGGWEEGRARFGYGVGEHATVLDDMRGAYSTLYVRRRFDVADPAAVQALVFKAFFDGGFICWLNGAEITRRNAGDRGEELPFDATSRGWNWVGPTPRTSFVSAAIEHLVPGENVLAVQALNFEVDDDEFTLDVALWANDALQVCPRDLVCLPRVRDGSIVLSWTPHATYDAIEITRDGVEVEGSPLAGDASEWTDVTVGNFRHEYVVTARLGSTACEPLRCSTASSFPLIDRHAEWSYFGSPEPPFDPPGAWRELDFDDAAWNRGVAGFGFGDEDDQTVVLDMRESYLALLLRHRFSVDDLEQVPGLLLRVRYDDGFVAWINGVEAARSPNMAELGDEVPFDAEAGSPHEAHEFEEFVIDASLLRPGDNVFTAQVHNASLTSGDLSFDPVLLSDPCGGGEPIVGAGCDDEFRRGDTDVDSVVTITDAVRIFDFLFRGTTEPPACPDAADSDDDGELSITDGIRILQTLFVGANEIPPPGLDVCGVDPTADGLGVCRYRACE